VTFARIEGIGVETRELGVGAPSVGIDSRLLQEL
jgi:hypothetical protein